MTILIPAFNEADRIGETVRAAQRLPGVREIIVVNDGSTDDTAAVSQEAGATVITQANGGKAKALTAGIEAAKYDLLLFLDADLGDTTHHAAGLIAPVAQGIADMSIATFPVHPGRGGGFGYVVRLSRWGIARATGRVMQAPLSGQRCITRKALNAALPLASGFGVETALTIDVLRAGFRVVEVETLLDHRVSGRDFRARLHRARQGRDVLRALAPRLVRGRNQ